MSDIAHTMLLDSLRKRLDQLDPNYYDEGPLPAPGKLVEEKAEEDSKAE